jgi:hypothetical protein
MFPKIVANFADQWRIQTHTCLLQQFDAWRQQLPPRLKLRDLALKRCFPQNIGQIPLSHLAKADPNPEI